MLRAAASDLLHEVRDVAVLQDTQSGKREGRASSVPAQTLATQVVVGRDGHARMEVDAEMILPRFGGQSDYAAIMDIRIFNSNSIGLT